jgi:shikimate dehydrogenase
MSDNQQRVDFMTKRACVVGWPVKHSRSPKLHGYWIKKYGLDATYGMEEIRPEDFEAFITSLAARGYAGCNITMPHKDAALALSQPDARAKVVGAANTLYLDNGVLRSTNTDVEGAMGALDQASPGWDKRTRSAVVLGAGGASRAVVYGLIERGLETIHVVNRTYAKAIALQECFGPIVQPARWSALPRLLDGAGLLMNATSLGLQGQPPLEIDLTPLAPDAVVFDSIYVPLTTPLLAQAQARGLKTANGLDMLLHQAVRGFELWFGKRPEVTREQFELLAADIPK